MMSLGNAESGMKRKVIYELNYPNLNLELDYVVEEYFCKECEEYHDTEYINVYVNNLKYKLPISRISYERIRKEELRKLYKQLRELFPKYIVNSVLGAVGNLLYLISRRSYIPKSAKKIVL